MKDVAEKAKHREYKTTMELNGKDMPELRDVHVDDVITVTMKLKATRITEGGYMGLSCCCEDCDEEQEERENKNKVSGSFEVQSVKFNGMEGQGKSTEASIAKRYNELIKKGISPSVAMQRAMKG